LSAWSLSERTDTACTAAEVVADSPSGMPWAQRVAEDLRACAREGWTGMLAALKVWMEHGINLREGFYS